MSEDVSEEPQKSIREVSRNFNPLLPKDLNKSVSDGLDKKSGLFSKFSSEDKHLNPQELQKNTNELFNLLVHRVELRIDISRHSEGTNGESGSKEKELTLNERLDLIKNGELRNAVSQVLEGDIKTRTIQEDLKELRETEEKISNLSENDQVVSEYSKFREKRVENLRQAKEVTDGQKVINKLHLQQEKMARTVFLDDRQYSPGERRIIDENKQIIQAINERISKLKENPEVFDLARLRQLEEYQRGLKKDRFAETPSREKYIDLVRECWAQGRKVLLTGPTGGGKTELLLHASRSLFGAEAEKLTGHELMTNYEVYGKTKGGVQDGKVTLMFGAAPFIRSLEKNVPFVFDEINVVPNKILMRLKTDLNARVGSRVTIQEDGDKDIVVGDNFALGATENVKSEKHKDREELDPALVRMFESMAIDYFPSDELYDIMLASIMDFQGGVKLSVNDASLTLKSLCDATEWIQKAYLGQTINTGSGQILEARGQSSVGKSATLRKAVLDPGKSLDMLVGWEDAQKSDLTFREFLNKRIMAFINNENFPEEDRYYLTEVFALQGFLKGVKVSELRVADLDQATLDAWSGYDGKRYIPKSSYTSPEIVAKLDPYGNLGRPVDVEAGDLLDEVEQVEDVEEDEVDITEAAKKAAQARTSKQQQFTPTNGKPTGGGVTYGGGPMSAEGKFKMDALDIQYDPKSFISNYNEEVLFKEYPKILVDIAKNEPSTIPAILDKFTTIIDSSIAERVLSGKWKILTDHLLEITNMAKGNKQLMLDIARIVTKVDSKDVWKSGSYKDNVKSNIDTIRDIVMGISR